MVKSCSVWGCTVRFRKGSTLGFYKFPNANTKKEQRAKWIERLGKADVDTDSGLKHLSDFFLLTLVFLKLSTIAE